MLIHLVPLASDRIMCGRDIPLGSDVNSGYGEITDREHTCPECLAAAATMYGTS